MTDRLLTIKEAADRLGVPAKALRRVAEDHGFIIKMGRAIRLDPNQLQEIIEKCRDQARAPASSPNGTASGISETEAESSVARALETANGLSKRSPDTLQNATGQPARVIPIK